MRRAAKVDANQKDVVDALRKVGASVQIMSSVGGGVPDLLIGFRGLNFLFEVKDGDKPASAQRLTPDQEKWHGTWLGQVAIVRGPEEAIERLLNLSGPNARQTTRPTPSDSTGLH